MSDWGTESLPCLLFCLGLFETNSWVQPFVSFVWTQPFVSKRPKQNSKRVKGDCLWLIADVFDKSQKRPKAKGLKFWGKNSAMCIPLLSQSPRCVYHSAESVSAVCTVHHSAKSDSAVCIPLRSQSPQCAFCFSLVAFKGTIRTNPFKGEHVYHERKD